MEIMVDTIGERANLVGKKFFGNFVPTITLIVMR